MRALTKIEMRALEILRKRDRMTCNMLGVALWGASGRPGSAPYARAAGKVLRSLLKEGLVTPLFDPRHLFWIAVR